MTGSLTHAVVVHIFVVFTLEPLSQWITCLFLVEALQVSSLWVFTHKEALLVFFTVHVKVVQRAANRVFGAEVATQRNARTILRSVGFAESVHKSSGVEQHVVDGVVLAPVVAILALVDTTVFFVFAALAVTVVVTNLRGWHALP